MATITGSLLTCQEISISLRVELLVPVVDVVSVEGHNAFPRCTFSQLEPLFNVNVVVLDLHSGGPGFGFPKVILNSIHFCALCIAGQFRISCTATDSGRRLFHTMGHILISDL